MDKHEPMRHEEHEHPMDHSGHEMHAQYNGHEMDGMKHENHSDHGMGFDGLSRSQTRI